jgi:chemotaxis response regulator CheB
LANDPDRYRRWDPDFKVVGVAHSGSEAVRLVKQYRPDLAVMDVDMPDLDGLAATKQIMSSEAPCPVVIISTLMDHHAQKLVFDALQAGAVEVLGKPRDVRAKINRERLLGTLKAMAHIKVVRRRPVPGSAPERTYEKGLVVIGASTGGPPAVREVLSSLPRNFHCPVIVAQHLAPGFAHGLRQWLAESIALKVALVDKPMVPYAGTVYLAPDAHHVELRSGALTPVAAEGDATVPSLDRLFSSLLIPGVGGVAVVLTGMGVDGAAGLGMLKSHGFYTIVQDGETSLIHGMPKAARDSGAAMEELPLSRIGPRLLALTQKPKGGE